MSKTGKKRQADQSAADARIERERRELSLALGDEAGFRLFIATYNDERRRDELIRQIVDEQPVPVSLIDLSDADPEGSFVPQLQSRIGQQSAKAAMVVGLEAILDYQMPDSRGLAILQTANLQRELLAKELPIAVVLWLSPLGTPAFAEAAPDLWHWRAGSFDFTGHGNERTEMLRDIVEWRSRREVTMTGAERQNHVATVENLLRELETQAAPASNRDASQRASLLRELGNGYARLGKPQRAIECHEQALATSLKVGDRQAEGAAIAGLGYDYLVVGELPVAIQHYENWLAISRELSDRRGECSALGSLGLAYHLMGEPRRAIECFEQALVISREIGDRHGERVMLDSLGNAYTDLGEPRPGIELLEQALAISRDIGDRGGEGTTLHSLGQAYEALSEPRRTIEFFERAIPILRECGDRRVENQALGGLIVAYIRLAEWHKAAKHIDQFLTSSLEIGNNNAICRAWLIGAVVLQMIGERTKAIEWMDQALSIEEAIEEPFVEQLRVWFAEWTAQEEASKAG